MITSICLMRTTTYCSVFQKDTPDILVRSLYLDLVLASVTFVEDFNRNLRSVLFVVLFYRRPHSVNDVHMTSRGIFSVTLY